MNKNIFYILLFVGVIAGFNSCSREEPNLFDKSPAERINEAVANMEALLSSSENGWIIDYFPNTNTEGYTYLAKFSSVYTVKMAAKNKYVLAYTERESTWNVIKDMGPVLTFDSYNNIFHLFAGPAAPGAAADGRGLEGDYEFLVLGMTNDVITLKGKKHGAITIARRMPEGKNWEEYINDLDKAKDYLLDRNFSMLRLTVKDSIYTLTNGTSGIFDALILGGNAITDTKKIPFLVTDYGILFSQNFVIDSISNPVRQFVFNSDKSQLIAADRDVDAKIQGAPAIDVFLAVLNTNNKYIVVKENDENMGSTIKTAYDILKNEVTSRSRVLNYVGFVNNRTRGISLALRTTGANVIEGLIGFNISRVSENEVSFSSTGSNDNNGNNYINAYNASQLVTVFEDTYTISSYRGEGFTPNIFRFVSKNDPNKWFDLFFQ
jgi:hypothetical protein